MNKKLHITYIILLSTIFVQNTVAQNFARATDWKKYRKEVIIQAGIAEFLGDLGGLDKIGTHNSPVDLEIVLTRPAISLAYRYKFAKNFNVHTSFNYLLVAGDDKLTKEPFRNNRNLNFKSNIFELATRAEFSFFSNKVGHRYGIKKTLSRRKKSRSWEWIGFVGIGAFYFNPKGLNSSGQYVKLRPLHTEGQGFAETGRENYSLSQISIPWGGGIKYEVSPLINLRGEFLYRKTFTDYLDDLSTTYIDPALFDKYLTTQKATNAKLLYDRQIENHAGVDGIRGVSKNKDGYFTFNLKISIVIGRERIRR